MSWSFPALATIPATAITADLLVVLFRFGYVVSMLFRLCCEYVVSGYHSI